MKDDIQIASLNGQISRLPSGLFIANKVIEFRSPTPLKVNQVVVVDDGTVRVRGRIIQSDWKGNAKMNTRDKG